MPNRIKVVNLISGFNDGGAQKVVYEIASRLQNDQDVDIRICVICKDEDSNLSRQCHEKNLKIDYLGFESSNRKNLVSKFKDFIRMNHLVRRYLNDVKPDVIHTHITSIFKYIPLALLQIRVNKRIHTHHSDPYAIDKISVCIATILFKVLRIKSICVSEEQKSKADKVYHLKKSVVVHNGIDFARINQIDPSEAKERLGIDFQMKVVGFVGRLERVKNITYALDVFSEYHKLNPNSLMIICGDGSQYTELKEYAKSIMIEENIRFMGNVRDLSTMYSAMDYFILTSFFESSSIVTLEAQAYEKTCFISDAVPVNTIYSKRVKRLSLKEAPALWAYQMSADNTDFDVPTSTKESYDINNCVNKMKEIYIEKLA